MGSMIKRWGEGKTLYSLCGLLEPLNLALLKIHSALSTTIILRPITLKSSGAYGVALGNALSQPISLYRGYGSEGSTLFVTCHDTALRRALSMLNYELVNCALRYVRYNVAVAVALAICGASQSLKAPYERLERVAIDILPFWIEL